MRLVFAGTPQTAVPSLDALLVSSHSVEAVLTRPDAPAGRGQRMAASAVAERARQAKIEILQPKRLSDPAFLARLHEIAPDCCPVVAYGNLIPDAALVVPRCGWVNLHFSLLPAWRGAAPVQHAIMHGDSITGATTFRLVSELDAGPVFGVVTEPVRPADTTGDLLGRLAVSGADLLVATLDGIESGELEARPQPLDGVSHAPKVDRSDARVNWKQPAQAVDRLIRACTPAPGAWTTLGGAMLKLGPVRRPATDDAGGPDDLGPGEVEVLGSGVFAGTGTTAVQLGDVQPEGKRRMAAADWARGLRGADRVFD
ncbi:MAG TPA: methionyl-tRNA formyltransferase [Streptosporangiaceae bacterium]|jgi:methionyl-tRNA formyltransferase|nr:methionyl-tRNA formyltransferase [Streptosporangiaceae bacterium]